MNTAQENLLEVAKQLRHEGDDNPKEPEQFRLKPTYWSE